MYNFTYIPKEEQDLDDKLINLYGSKLLDLYTALKPIYYSDVYTVKPTLPILLWLKNDANDWVTADIKVVIYGRETNNWEDSNPNSEFFKTMPNWNLKNSDDVRKEIDSIQNLYDDHFNFSLKEDSKRLFFARGFLPLAKLISDAFPQKKVNCIWNNISKIGNGYNLQRERASSGKPKSYIQAVELKSFNVSQSELDILKPDVVIFLAGKEADQYIKDKFNIESFAPVSPDYPELSEVKIPNVRYALKTSFKHPSARMTKEEIDRYYLHYYPEKMISLIKKALLL